MCIRDRRIRAGQTETCSGIFGSISEIWKNHSVMIILAGAIVLLQLSLIHIFGKQIKRNILFLSCNIDQLFVIKSKSKLFCQRCV